MPVSGMDEHAIIMEGWLFKSDPAGRHWRHRWCVLTASKFQYFVNEEKAIMRGSFDMPGSTFQVGLPAVKSAPPTLHVFRVVTPARVFFFAAHDAEDVRRWNRAHQQAARAIVSDPAQRGAASFDESADSQLLPPTPVPAQSRSNAPLQSSPLAKAQWTSQPADMPPLPESRASGTTGSMQSPAARHDRAAALRAEESAAHGRARAAEGNPPPPPPVFGDAAAASAFELPTAPSTAPSQPEPVTDKVVISAIVQTHGTDGSISRRAKPLTLRIPRDRAGDLPTGTLKAAVAKRLQCSPAELAIFANEDQLDQAWHAAAGADGRYVHLPGMADELPGEQLGLLNQHASIVVVVQPPPAQASRRPPALAPVQTRVDQLASSPPPREGATERQARPSPGAATPAQPVAVPVQARIERRLALQRVFYDVAGKSPRNAAPDAVPRAEFLRALHRHPATAGWTGTAALVAKINQRNAGPFLSWGEAVAALEQEGESLDQGTSPRASPTQGLPSDLPTPAPHQMLTPVPTVVPRATSTVAMTRVQANVPAPERAGLVDAAAMQGLHPDAIAAVLAGLPEDPDTEATTVVRVQLDDSEAGAVDLQVGAFTDCGQLAELFFDAHPDVEQDDAAAATLRAELACAAASMSANLLRTVQTQNAGLRQRVVLAQAALTAAIKSAQHRGAGLASAPVPEQAELLQRLTDAFQAAANHGDTAAAASIALGRPAPAGGADADARAADLQKQLAQAQVEVAALRAALAKSQAGGSPTSPAHSSLGDSHGAQAQHAAEARVWASEKKTMIMRFNADRAALLEENKRLRRALASHGGAASASARLATLDDERVQLLEDNATLTGQVRHLEEQLATLTANWEAESRTWMQERQRLRGFVDTLTVTATSPVRQAARADPNSALALSTTRRATGSKSGQDLEDTLPAKTTLLRNWAEETAALAAVWQADSAAWQAERAALQRQVNTLKQAARGGKQMAVAEVSPTSGARGMY